MTNPACVAAPHVALFDDHFNAILHRRAPGFWLGNHDVEANMLFPVVILVLMWVNSATVSYKAAKIFVVWLLLGVVQIVSLNNLPLYLPHLWRRVQVNTLQNPILPSDPVWAERGSMGNSPTSNRRK
jgi:hypothetical protein